MELKGVSPEDLTLVEFDVEREGRVFCVRMPASDPDAYWRNVIVPRVSVGRGVSPESVAETVRALAAKWKVDPAAEVQAIVLDESYVQRVCETYEVLPYQLHALAKATGDLQVAIQLLASACRECPDDATSAVTLESAYQKVSR